MGSLLVQMGDSIICKNGKWKHCQRNNLILAEKPFCRLRVQRNESQEATQPQPQRRTITRSYIRVDGNRSKERLPVTWLNTIWRNFFVESFGLKILSQVTTKLSQLHSNPRNKYVNSRKYHKWGICGVCTLALIVAKTSSHYDRFAIFVPARSLLLFDLA